MLLGFLCSVLCVLPILVDVMIKSSVNFRCRFSAAAAEIEGQNVSDVNVLKYSVRSFYNQGSIRLHLIEEEVVAMIKDNMQTSSF